MMAERLSSLAARGGGEEMKNWADELVGQARGSVHVVAGLARVSAVRGRAVRRPAMGVTTRQLISEAEVTVA